MTIEQLKHAIRAACNVSGDHEVLIFGSQAILGAFPDAPEDLLTSLEVDLQPKNKPESTDAVDGPLGELSAFHQTHGFYVHSYPIAQIALPSHWEDRVIRVVDDIGTQRFVGLCLEPHDLAASKLIADREKDRDYVRTLIVEHLIDPVELIKRLESTDIEEPAKLVKLREWVEETAKDLEG